MYNVKDFPPFSLSIVTFCSFKFNSTVSNYRQLAPWFTQDLQSRHSARSLIHSCGLFVCLLMEIFAVKLSLSLSLIFWFSDAITCCKLTSGHLEMSKFFYYYYCLHDWVLPPFPTSWSIWSKSREHNSTRTWHFMISLSLSSGHTNWINGLSPHLSDFHDYFSKTQHTRIQVEMNECNHIQIQFNKTTNSQWQ